MARLESLVAAQPEAVEMAGELLRLATEGSAALAVVALAEAELRALSTER
jgi:hypothetical protein